MHTPSVPTGHPRNPRAVGVSYSSIAMAWDTVDHLKRHGDITMYEVLYLPSMMYETLQEDPENINMGVKNVAMIQTTDRLVFLRNLMASTSYILFVRAINIHGAGPYSEVVATTLEMLSAKLNDAEGIAGIDEVPTASPLNLLAVAMAPGIALTWDELSVNQWNGVTYEVLSKTLVGECTTATCNLVNTTVPFVSLANLEGGVTYQISVRARNENGPGPYSEAVIVTTLMDDTPAGLVNATLPTHPGAPRNVIVDSVTSTALVLKWDQANATELNGEDYFYAVHYQALVEGSTEEVVNTTELGIALTELNELTLYAFSVRAITVAGPSPYSELGFARTEESSKPR